MKKRSRFVQSDSCSMILFLIVAAATVRGDIVNATDDIANVTMESTTTVEVATTSMPPLFSIDDFDSTSQTNTITYEAQLDVDVSSELPAPEITSTKVPSDVTEQIATNNQIMDQESGQDMEYQFDQMPFARNLDGGIDRGKKNQNKWQDNKKPSSNKKKQENNPWENSWANTPRPTWAPSPYEYENNEEYDHGYAHQEAYGQNNYESTPYYPETTTSTVLPPDSSVTCWHCDAPTFQECYEKGKAMECHQNRSRPPVCMTEVRKRDGKLHGVCMGCKAYDACLEQKANNFPKGKFPWQCQPRATYGPSVCRQCCNTDLCTENFNPNNYKGWNQDMIQSNVNSENYY